MWWRRDQCYSRNSVTCLRNDFVYLETWQLATFTRLCTLCNLYLNLFGIDKIFCCNAETSRSNLLRLTAKAHAVYFCMVTSIVLTTLTSVASRAKLVHSECKSLVSLYAQRSERHRTRDEMLHDALNRFHLFKWGRDSSLLK